MGSIRTQLLLINREKDDLLAEDIEPNEQAQQALADLEKHHHDFQQRRAEAAASEKKQALAADEKRQLLKQFETESVGGSSPDYEAWRAAWDNIGDAGVAAAALDQRFQQLLADPVSVAALSRDEATSDIGDDRAAASMKQSLPALSDDEQQAVDALLAQGSRTRWR